MEEQSVVYEVIKVILLWTSPFIFLEGVLLLFVKRDKHIKLEQTLGKEIGGIKKRVFPKIETNIYTFQNQLLKKPFLLGLLFIFYSICLFVTLMKIIFLS